MSLIIVESPTKARTFNRILKGEDYYVFATMGHFRDLPTKKISIDYSKNFKPDYQIIKGKTDMVEKLKELAKKNKEVILATDLDREGESISYHVAVVLGYIKENWPDFKINSKKKFKRIVFHEITAKALKDALSDPGEIRENLVKAQQARRILDRIVGYELSPLLWKKMGKNWLSAGRVQTVALRIIVEREKEINKFKQEEYYQIDGLFGNDKLQIINPQLNNKYQISNNNSISNEQNSNEQIKARLISKDELPYEIKTKIQLFDGEYTYTKTIINEELANSIKNDLQGDSFLVSDVKEDIVKRYPPPPFTTSLLQQDSFRRFGFSSKMTMSLAQNLYEQGLITYHRTDSFQLASFFVFKAKDYIEAKFGKNFALEKPRGFVNRSKLAQEAHEAIRPTSLEKDPEGLKIDQTITQNHKKLYELIFNRALSTQMKEAEIKTIKIFIKSGQNYLFEADDEQVIFPGFFKVLNPSFLEKKSMNLKIKKDEKVKLSNVDLVKSLSKPPPRYNEASLIKTMEEKGIGRPSTYAPIISLIQDKYYVEKDMRNFIPTKLGQSISDYLSAAFRQLFDLNFTAKMEESLDLVAEGQENFINTLNNFYPDFKKELDIKKADKTVIDVEEKIDEKCGKCNGNLVVRFSKYGRFLGCKNYPKCRFIKPYLNFVKERFCPECKGRIVVRFTKTKKRFYGCENYPNCKYSAWKLNTKF